jgi:hypothetical protein
MGERAFPKEVLMFAKANQIRSAVLVLLCICGVQGCFVSKPPKNVGFGRATTLHDLEGNYVNQGEVKEGDPTAFLSAIIWPNDPDLAHGNIETVEVRAEGDTLLTVRAIGSHGDVTRTSAFRRGKQFDLREGRILLKRKSSGVVPHRDGDVMLGVVSETVELGIDARGDAKYKTTSVAAGLVYLVIPIAGGDTREVRFRKLHE